MRLCYPAIVSKEPGRCTLCLVYCASEAYLYWFVMSSIFDSSHYGGSYGRHEQMTSLDEQVQLFAKPGAIKFPLKDFSDAWQEKVVASSIHYFISYLCF